MPHDSQGRPVAEGEIVTLKARVGAVSTGEKDCNTTFHVIVPDGVDESYAPSFAGNTRLGTVVDVLPTPTITPPVAHVLQFFKWEHLPSHLQAVSRPFGELAQVVAAQASNQETTIALRKLLEAKDAAVRAVLAK